MLELRRNAACPGFQLFVANILWIFLRLRHRVAERIKPVHCADFSSAMLAAGHSDGRLPTTGDRFESVIEQFGRCCLLNFSSPNVICNK
jgi:hypothetical protein